jgi:uncharacterized protein YecE (DUF72 family)
MPARIGCAGWALPSAMAAFFPASGSHLERYAQVFSAVEINSSFYRPHQAKTYARWAASVPDTFRFSVKIPRTISHELRLRGSKAAVSQFSAEVASLGEKLGCLLVQTPPSLALDRGTARNFFSQLRDATNAAVVCEPRHVTWFSEQGAELMREAGVSCVWADPPPVAGAAPVSDSDPLYIRLHGSPRIYYSAYEQPFLQAMSRRIIKAQIAHTEVWCIFDNTAAGQAVPNALALMEYIKKASS